jgi:site-specific DNA-methyltransferase (adenine-specific)
MAERIEHWPLERLKPYSRNARTHSQAQIDKIAASIAEFGFTNPILVDSSDGIIAGHGRLMGAQKLGMDTVPVVVLDYLTDSQRRAYILADNRLALDAGWDEEILAAELADLEVDGFDLELTGFSDEELADLMSDEDIPTVLDEDTVNAVPEVRPEPVSRLGDVWLLGKHRVMCGDSLSIDQVEQLMGGALADLLLTDPPYNVAYEGKTAEALTIENDSMADGDFRQFLRDAFAAADAVMRPGAGFYIWHADSEGFNFRGAARDVGWKVRQCLIWNKNAFVLGRQDYHWKHEPCLYGWKEGAAHYWGSDRSQTTVLDFNRPSRNAEHPTMKPVELFEYQVRNSCPPGGVTLDLFGGSGTTLLACEISGHVARLMELDPRYVDVIVVRWQEATGRTAHLEATGQSFADLETGRASDVNVAPFPGFMTAGRPFTEQPANDNGAVDEVA